MEIIGTHREITAKTSKIYGVGVCDIGCVRKNNEDNMVLRQLWTDNYMLAVVIDGVGGQEGGEVAAAIAAESISNFLDVYRNGEPQELLCQAVLQANNDILSRREQEPRLAYMSCVLTAAIIDSRNSQVYMAHVGDTRLYLYTNGKLQKLSHDHSLVGYREEMGDLTEEEAMHHPQRNIISRDVGSEHQVSASFVESASFPLYGKNIIMLCSDGLCDMITSAQMSSILEKEEELGNHCRELVEAAKKAGGRDNVTVLLVEYTSEKQRDNSQLSDRSLSEDTGSQKESVVEEETIIDNELQKKSNQPKHRRNRTFLIIAVAVFLLAVGFSALHLRSKTKNSAEATTKADSTELTIEKNWVNPYISDKITVEEYNTASALFCSTINVLSLSQIAEIFEYTCFSAFKNNLPDSLTAIAIKHNVIYDNPVFQGESVWCECREICHLENEIVFQTKMLSERFDVAHGECTFEIKKK
ncbi:MAG: serine/threonine-protein phosphatase [Bacteroidales bacterium]|nr:serine/threonine-protein phosphatase [Bacteroidales bacterium]